MTCPQCNADKPVVLDRSYIDDRPFVACDDCARAEFARLAREENQ